MPHGSSSKPRAAILLIKFPVGEKSAMTPLCSLGMADPPLAGRVARTATPAEPRQDYQATLVRWRRLCRTLPADGTYSTGLCFDRDAQGNPEESTRAQAFNSPVLDGPQGAIEAVCLSFFDRGAS